MTTDTRLKTVAIIVNTRPFIVHGPEITFEEVVALAYPDRPITDQDDVTVRYSRGVAGHNAGTLTAGHSVKSKIGMVFDVHRTTRS